ncbi:MAG TPA: hypothetical protein PLS73_11145 [Saprospiraceae bacterium]|nr:hypothetical protein [Saprospiraceae bacterium]
MRIQFYFLLFAFVIFSCKVKENQSYYFVDESWIEVHFKRSMSTEELVSIRDKLVPYGVIVKYLVIQRDSLKNISLFQIEVQDGKGKIARSRTEFLDEIPYGIRIHRGDPSDDGFKVGPLYEKRPQ